MQITSGIPQGSPLSGILYLFYNADLLEDINPHDSSSSLGYIDDIGILVIGNSTEENCRSLATIHEMVCKPWADTHGSSFAVSKYQLIHFTRRTSSNINHRLLLSSGQQVTPMPSVVYLGIIFDVKLKWNAQLALIKAKVQKKYWCPSQLWRVYLGSQSPSDSQNLHCSRHFPDDIRTVNLVHTKRRTMT